MPDPLLDSAIRTRSAAWPAALVALAVLLTGILVTALTAGNGVEQRITDRQVAGIRAALQAQAPGAAALGRGDLYPGARPLQAIAEAARARAGGTARIVDEDGTLMLQTDSFTRTDSSAETSAAIADGHWRTTVIDSASGRQRVTTVPLRTSIRTIALVAITPAREASLADGAHEAIRRGALIGFGTGLLVLLAAAGYFRRKALIRSPKRS